MKKFIAVVFLLLVAAVVDILAQTEIQLLRLRDYSNPLLSKAGSLDSKYVFSATDDDYDRFSVLGGAMDAVDTPLEIALLSYSAGVVNIRPPEANAILPEVAQKVPGTENV
jgi:hypothetical protein